MTQKIFRNHFQETGGKSSNDSRTLLLITNSRRTSLQMLGHKFVKMWMTSWHILYPLQAIQQVIHNGDEMPVTFYPQHHAWRIQWTRYIPKWCKYIKLVHIILQRGWSNIHSKFIIQISVYFNFIFIMIKFWFWKNIILNQFLHFKSYKIWFSINSKML